MKLSCFLITCSLYIFTSCSKNVEEENYKMMQGKWFFSSQTDDFQNGTAPTVYPFSGNLYVNFTPDGKVYSPGIATPTWVFTPLATGSPYWLEKDIIIAGDAHVINGMLTEIQPRKRFQIASISSDRMVWRIIRQHPLVTTVTLVRK